MSKRMEDCQKNMTKHKYHLNLQRIGCQILAYSSNKIRKTQNGHLIIVCQNLVTQDKSIVMMANIKSHFNFGRKFEFRS